MGGNGPPVRALRLLVPYHVEPPISVPDVVAVVVVAVPTVIFDGVAVAGMVVAAAAVMVAVVAVGPDLRAVLVAVVRRVRVWLLDVGGFRPACVQWKGRALWFGCGSGCAPLSLGAATTGAGKRHGTQHY